MPSKSIIIHILYLSSLVTMTNPIWETLRPVSFLNCCSDNVNETWVFTFHIVSIPNSFTFLMVNLCIIYWWQIRIKTKLWLLSCFGFLPCTYYLHPPPHTHIHFPHGPVNMKLWSRNQTQTVSGFYKRVIIETMILFPVHFVKLGKLLLFTQLGKIN